MKNTILKLSLIASIFLATNSLAQAQEQDQKLSGFFDYDVANGYWWYKEKYKDAETGKEFELKTKYSKKEKQEHDKKSKVEKLLELQVSQLKELNKRQAYANPYLVPEYTTNSKTGKKCKTNSSEDCFVFPLQADAQRTPVLGNWLREPSPTNAKEWLKWESKYFNHLESIALANRFAFLEDGDKVYKTGATHVYSESAFNPLGDENKMIAEQKFIEENAEKIGLYFFLGKTTKKEKAIGAYKKMWRYGANYLKDVSKYIVVPSQEFKDYLLEDVKNSHISEAIDFYRTANIVVAPDQFEKHSIRTTPTVVGAWKDGEEGKLYHQKIEIGTVDRAVVRKSYLAFLTYNKIVKPGDFSYDKNNNNIHTWNEKREIETNTSKVWKETPTQITGGGK